VGVNFAENWSQRGVCHFSVTGVSEMRTGRKNMHPEQRSASILKERNPRSDGSGRPFKHRNVEDFCPRSESSFY
jgi:hypothetical protein